MTANVLDEATLRDARAMCRVGADALFRDVCDSHESLRSQLAEARAENDFLRGVSTASSHNEHDMGQLIQELKAERDALVAEVEQLRAVANEIAAEKQRAREDAWQLRTYNAALREKLAAAELDLEQARVQLAGCGVAAMQNTKKTIADRACPGDYGWSASYGDVCRAVDREMAFRDALAAVRKTLKEIADNPCGVGDDGCACCETDGAAARRGLAAMRLAEAQAADANESTEAGSGLTRAGDNQPAPSEASAPRACGPFKSDAGIQSTPSGAKCGACDDRTCVCSNCGLPITREHGGRVEGRTWVDAVIDKALAVQAAELLALRAVEAAARLALSEPDVCLGPDECPDKGNSGCASVHKLRTALRALDQLRSGK